MEQTQLLLILGQQHTLVQHLLQTVLDVYLYHLMVLDPNLRNIQDIQIYFLLEVVVPVQLIY